MAIVLSNGWTKHTKKSGADTFKVAAGNFLKIETSPEGVEHLCAQVPEGKSWAVSIYVDIRETDA